MRKARFDDRCRLCLSPVNAGDSVSWTADNLIAHLRCATDLENQLAQRTRRDAEQARKRRALSKGRTR